MNTDKVLERPLKNLSKMYVHLLRIVHGNHNAPSGIEFYMEQYFNCKTTLIRKKLEFEKLKSQLKVSSTTI